MKLQKEMLVDFLGLYAKKDPSFVYDLDYKVTQHSVMNIPKLRGNTKTIKDVNGSKFANNASVKVSLRVS